ncbi:MAG: lysophospholipase [Chloroflexi bacterium]|nr:lysophospholipase [Chloroflexota bacterium]
MPTSTATLGAATTRDGIPLVTRHWAPAGPARAGILLVHGLGEHSGRYDHVGAQLAAAGLETFAWDHRGFGASGGERASIERWDQFHEDVEDRLADVRAALRGKPVVLYGHSMGGLIALGYALSDRPRPDLLVLSAPGIDDNLAGWKRAAAPILARVAPNLRVSNGISPAMLSRDAGRQDAAAHDPLMLGATTARFGAVAFAAQPEVRAALGRLEVPTLVIHGLDDPIVPARATEAFASMPDCTRRAYPGIRHELHNEPEGPAIIADVITWIDGRLAASQDPTAGAARPTAGAARPTV